MKNIIKSTALLLCSLAFFTACDDDRDNNPTIQTPTTFVLNTPSYAQANVDLATSESLAFSWSQPDYGFPALASYQIQVRPPTDGRRIFRLARRMPPTRLSATTRPSTRSFLSSRVA